PDVTRGLFLSTDRIKNNQHTFTRTFLVNATEPNIELQSTFNVTITFVLQTGCVHIEDHRFVSPPDG
ncbi:hypothetical protein ABLA30_15765, partial [Xenorhabdus nematophila]|uniref:hypothetical protein n=1 Tax=Xenorhabdus nematophila TaxID=628 RepID=UPI0032B81ADB